MQSYQGRRFAAFVLTSILMFGGLCMAGDHLPAFLNAVGLAFGAYVAGQSATDYVKQKNGHS
jgi:hypothetical protein